LIDALRKAVVNVVTLWLPIIGDGLNTIKERVTWSAFILARNVDFLIDARVTVA